MLAGTNKLGTIISIKQMQINRAGIRQTKSKQQTANCFVLHSEAKVKEMRLDYVGGIELIRAMIRLLILFAC